MDGPKIIKICTKCKKHKERREFNKNKNMKDGLQGWCKLCCSEYKKQYQQNISEKIKKQKKKHYDNNSEKLKEQKKQYYKNNIEKLRERNFRWRKNNPEHESKYRKEKYRSDPVYRIKQNLRSGLCRVVKRGSKTKTMKLYLGCSIKELKIYLENKFYKHPVTKERMAWDNYNLHSWHIDHIIPVASIKSEDDIEQIKKVCHYTNLQPLWVIDHNKKTAIQIKQKWGDINEKSIHSYPCL